MLRIPTGMSVYIGRHTAVVIRHLTLKKLVNLAINQVEYLLRRRRLGSRPVFLKAEPTVLCQLRCKGCVHSHPGFNEGLPKNAFLTFNDFRRILEPLADTTLAVSLSLRGEPMLNKDLVAMIEFAHSKNVGVDFPTNFSLRFSDDFLDRLVRSGLDKILVSLDGASRETYEQYRVGGNFDLVRANVQRLSAIKKRLRSKTPHIEWKFVVFDHNKHEMKYAKRNFGEWGFDSVSFVHDYSSDISDDASRREFRAGRSCFWLYRAIMIDWDGSITPCCTAVREWDIGNAFTTDIRSLWNNRAYQSMREGFGFRRYGKKMHPLCRRCFRLDAEDQ